MGISNHDLKDKVKDSRGLVDLMKACLSKEGISVLSTLLNKIKIEKKISQYLYPIQTTFFQNYKEPRVASKTNEEHQTKVTTIQKLGAVLPKILHDEFFNHFD